MKQKTIDCLTLADMPVSKERKNFYNKIITEHTEKVVLRKIEELIRRGILVSIPNSKHVVLTEKGKEILQSARTEANTTV